MYHGDLMLAAHSALLRLIPPRPVISARHPIKAGLICVILLQSRYWALMLQNSA